MTKKADLQRTQRISFSEKNTDIYELLEDKKKIKGFNTSDYICEAIRFYEQNKNFRQQLNLDTVKKLIDDKLEEFRKNLINEDISITQLEEKVNEKELLEAGIEDISDIEDD